jgi:hypothetical protein
MWSIDLLLVSIALVSWIYLALCRPKHRRRIAILGGNGYGNSRHVAIALESESYPSLILIPFAEGVHGTGFRPSPFATPDSPTPVTRVLTIVYFFLRVPVVQEPYGDYNGPHLVMTYTALLALAILRDDFSKLDRPGLVKFIRACQRDDGR